MSVEIGTDDTIAHQDHPGVVRRNLLKLTGAGVAAFGATSILSSTNAEAQNTSEEWDKVRIWLRPSRSPTSSAIAPPFLS